MFRILGDLWELGVDTYNELEETIHNQITRRKKMRIKIVRKCRNGNMELKYFDSTFNCWLPAFESEANLRRGIEEGSFVVENDSNNAQEGVADNSLLAQARAANTNK